MATTDAAATTGADSTPSPPPARLATEGYVDKRIAELRSDIYRAMLIQTGAIAAIVFGIIKL